MEYMYSSIHRLIELIIFMRSNFSLKQVSCHKQKYMCIEKKSNQRFTIIINLSRPLWKVVKRLSVILSLYKLLEFY